MVRGDLVLIYLFEDDIWATQSDQELDDNLIKKIALSRW